MIGPLILGMMNSRPSEFDFSKVILSDPSYVVWLNSSDTLSINPDTLVSDGEVEDGDPVGLFLDMSNGGEVGSTIVTNGDFSGGSTGWVDNSTSPAEATVVNGELILSTDVSSNNDARYSQSLSVDEGVYRVRVLVEEIIGNANFTVSVIGSPIVNVDVSDILEGEFDVFFHATSSGSVTLNLENISNTTDTSARISYVEVAPVIGNHAYQTTTASKLTYRTDGEHNWLESDGDDDFINIEVPAGGWAGTYVQGTMAGVIVGEISVPEGTYSIPTDPSYDNAGTMTDLVIRNDNGNIDIVELNRLIHFVGGKGAYRKFEGELAFDSMFRGREDLTSIDLSRLNPGGPVDFFFTFFGVSNLVKADLSGIQVERLRGTFRSTSLVELKTEDTDFSLCSNLNEAFQASPIEVLDVSNWDLSSLTGSERFVNGCGNLTTVIVYGGSESNFAGSPCTDYDRAFQSTNLSQQSYEDVVTAIEAAGTSNGILGITGGSAITTGLAKTAVDSLRARGWTVDTPDGY